MTKTVSLTVLILALICNSVFAQNSRPAQDESLKFAINSLTGEMEMTKKDLKAATLSIVGGKDPDSKLISFKLKVPGFPVKIVAGDKLEPANHLIDRTAVGDMVVLYDAQMQTKKFLKSPLLITIKE